jgi:hypothetical protein
MKLIRRRLRKLLPYNYLLKFNDVPFSERDKAFILNCLKQQQDNCYQLTVAQWEILRQIEKKYGVGWINAYERSFRKKRKK